MCRQINKTVLRLFVFIIISHCCACGVVSRDVVLTSRFDCLEYAKQFGGLSSRERIARFDEFDINTQYCIFLYCNQIVHPPLLNLGTELARQPLVLPFIVNKLKDAEDDLTIRDTIYVIEQLSSLKLYAVSQDKELMKLLYKKANEIKDVGWRDLTIKFVNKIDTDRAD